MIKKQNKLIKARITFRTCTTI